MQNSALLIVDVQKALCAGEGATFDAQKVISKINEVITKSRAARIPVIFVQHETTTGPFIYESDGWQIAEGLNNSEADIFVRKSASDSFQNTELKAQLDALEINHLVVCGMQSEFCVDSTIRRALALGYPVTVVEDGHTTVDNEVLSASLIAAHHNHTWQNITSYGPRAIPIPADQIKFSAS